MPKLQFSLPYFSPFITIPYKVYDRENLLAEETVYKNYMADGVKRIVVKSGQIRGTLFLPPGKMTDYFPAKGQLISD